MSAKCATCGEPVQRNGRTGRPRRYCSGRCRTEAYRDRQAAAFYAEPVPTPLQPPGPVIRAELLEVADSLIEGTQAAPPEEQLTRAVIETSTLAGHFRRLEPLLPKGLAWRAGEASKRLDATVDDLFTPNESSP